METTDYGEVAEEVVRRASKHVWCSFATVDRAGRPRSRVVHPVWEGPHGWVGTFAGSHKEKHLAKTPYVSCAYVDAEEPLYVDCAVTRIEDLETKQHAWDFIKRQKPEPYGFDPGMIWTDGPGGANFGLWRLDPWRIEVYTANPPNPPVVAIWRPG